MKMKTKKTLWYVLVAVLVVALAACLLAACDDKGGNDTTQNTSCAITYYTYGNEPHTATVEKGTAYSLPVPQRTGYTFVGYYDELEGGVQYVDQEGRSVAGLEMMTETFRLFAHWTPLTYVVRLNAADGSLSGEASLTLRYDEGVADMPVPTKEHCDFVGWYAEGGVQVTDQNGVCKYDVFGEDLAALVTDGKLDLLAHYAPTLYAVSFSLNDGSGEIREVRAAYGTPLADVAPTVEDTETRSFVGWSVVMGGEAEDDVTVTGAATYYGVWYAFRYVYFYVDPADVSPAFILKLLDDGKTKPLPAEPDVIKKGYKLVEWYDNAYYSGVPSTTLIYGNGKERYFAKWEETSYTVSFRTQVGELDDVTYWYGDSKALPSPERPGYTFNGWSLQEDLTGDLITAITPDTYGNLTLYAKYTANTYQVTLKKRNGDGDSRVKVKFASTFTLAVPTRTGYDFMGWYDASAGGRQMAGADGKSAYPYATVGDATYYAYWKAKTLSVTFVYGNGDEDLVVRAPFDSKIEAPDEPTKDGVFFNGWYDENEVEFRFDRDLLKGDLTLHAAWIDSVTVSSAEGFMAIADNPALNYHLDCDIDLKGQTLPTLPEFSGILDGCGYVVSNFVFSGDGTSVGFIGTNKGVIKNISFENFTSSIQLISQVNEGTAYFGFLCTYNKGAITDCSVRNANCTFVFTPYCSSWVDDWGWTYSLHLFFGLLCAGNSGVISGCRFADTTVNVTAGNANNNPNKQYCWGSTNYVAHYYYGAAAGVNGGEVSYCDTQTTLNLTAKAKGQQSLAAQRSYAGLKCGGLVGANDKTVSRCSSADIVTVTGEEVYLGINELRFGGLVGDNRADGQCSECYSGGSVTLGGVYDKSSTYAGALAYANEGAIVNCYSAANITVEGDTLDTGFVGRHSGTMRNCYYSGEISVAGTQAGLGFLGWSDGAGKANNCVFAAKVTAAASEGLGHFVGHYGNGAVFANCVYDADMDVSVEGGVTQENPTGVSAVDRATLLTADYLASLSFDENVWRTADGEHFPTLRWME